MTILREWKTWKRTPTPGAFEPLNRLSPEQQENVRLAIGILKIRYGSLAKAAAALCVHQKTLTRSATKRGAPTPGLALRVAEGVGATVDDVLSGAFPAPGCCPFCGRTL